MITLEEKVIAALTPAEACVLAEALDQLGKMSLEANARWRLTQIEHVLCARPDRREDLQEP